MPVLCDIAVYSVCRYASALWYCCVFIPSLCQCSVILLCVQFITMPVLLGSWHIHPSFSGFDLTVTLQSEWQKKNLCSPESLHNGHDHQWYARDMICVFLPLQKHLNVGAPSGAVEARSLKRYMVISFITSVWLHSHNGFLFFKVTGEFCKKKATGRIFFLIWVSVEWTFALFCLFGFNSLDDSINPQAL